MSSAQVAGGTLWRPGRASIEWGRAHLRRRRTHGHASHVQDPQRGARRHTGSGKTTLVEALLHRGRGGPARRPRRGRHDGVRHRARGGQTDDVAVAGARAVRVDRAMARRTRSTSSTRPATPTSWARSMPRWRSPTSPWSSSARSMASRSARRSPGGSAAAPGIPRMVFVNKEDKAARRLPRRARQLRSNVRAAASRRSSCRSARRTKFHGVADVLTEQGFEYEPTAAPHRADPRRRRRPKSTSSTTSWWRRSSPATTSSSSGTSSARCPPPPSSSARSPTRCSTASSSPCSRLGASPVSASTGSPTSSARSGRRRRIAR